MGWEVRLDEKQATRGSVSAEQAVVNALDAAGGLITGDPLVFYDQLSAHTGIDTRRLAAAVDRLHAKRKIWKLLAYSTPQNRGPKPPRYVAGLVDRKGSRRPDRDVSHLGYFEPKLSRPFWPNSEHLAQLSAPTNVSGRLPYLAAGTGRCIDEGRILQHNLLSQGPSRRRRVAEQ